MNNNLEEKDIHSKKVQHIMGEALPWFVRYGTAIIALLLILLALFIQQTDLWNCTHYYSQSILQSS